VSKTREDIEKAIVAAIEDNWEHCRDCEGEGNHYADGKAHYYSEHAPTVRCGTCGGTGKVPSGELETVIADALMQLPALQLAEKAEENIHYEVVVIDLRRAAEHNPYQRECFRKAFERGRSCAVGNRWRRVVAWIGCHGVELAPSTTEVRNGNAADFQRG
jgi:excinuclease UvrABC ATPase subunit